MLLADDLRYVIGFPADDSQRDRDDCDRRNSEFITLVNAWQASAPDDPVAAAVASFFERGLHRKLAGPPESAKATDVTAIMVSEFAHARPSARTFWASTVRDRKSSAGTGICLVCHTTGPLLGTIPEMVARRDPADAPRAFHPLLRNVAAIWSIAAGPRRDTAGNPPGAALHGVASSHPLDGAPAGTWTPRSAVLSTSANRGSMPAAPLLAVDGYALPVIVRCR
jgi:hypothetical protein